MTEGLTDESAAIRARVVAGSSDASGGPSSV